MGFRPRRYITRKGVVRARVSGRPAMGTVSRLDGQ
jgi:hypothetical protein